MHINDSQMQLTLDLDCGLTTRFSSVLEVVAAGVYQRGLKRMAADLDEAPGNLSVQLSGDGQRKFGVDQMERYIQATGDKTVIHYLVAKYCGDASAAREEALERVQTMLGDLTQALTTAGLNKRKR